MALSADGSLGYLAVTGKCEEPVRDRVAWYFQQRHPDLIAAREYYIKSENDRRRVDLAILKKASPGLHPLAFVEFKAVIAPPLDQPEHRLMESLESDLKRLADISPPVPRFGVMLVVRVEDPERLEKRGLDDSVAKHMSSFRRGAEKPDGLRKAIANVQRFFNGTNHKVSRPFTIELGSVWGAGVKLVGFILRPR